MTWDAYNRRKEALREVLAIADRRREEATATELLNEVEGAKAAFGDEVELLLDLQMNWYQHLSGQLDRTLSVGADDLEALTIDAWSTIASERPGTRVLLDAGEDRAEMHLAFAKEHEFLGRSAGIPGDHPDLLAHGRRIKEAARGQVVDIPVIPDTPAGLFNRIRGAFAA